MELAKIPGYLEALAAAQAEEETQRDLAFLEVDLDICGEPVRPLTLRHLLLLYVAQSPFFGGPGRVGPEHVAQFLWIVSPHFRLGDQAARAAFNDRIGDVILFEEAVPAIDAYIDAAMMDRPPRPRSPSAAAITSFAANLIDEIASEYGWTRAEILDCPLAVLYQQLRRIDRRHTPPKSLAATPGFSRATDRVNKAFLKKWKAMQVGKNPAPAKGKGKRR